MLVNFRFENFLSFDNLTTFSMAPGKSRQHMENLIDLGLKNKQKLLKLSTIYGANASGKSSLVYAIGVSKSLIIRGFHENLVLSNSYNKNSAENSSRETKFEFDIVIGDKVYSYGFSVILSLKKFMSEWLYDITNEEKLIYVINRKDNFFEINKDFLDLDDQSDSRISIYLEDSANDGDRLFLNSINDGKKIIESKNNSTLFREVFNWFNNTLEVLGPGDEARGSFASLTKEEKEFKENLGKYLELNDTGVIDIVQVPVENLPNVPAKIQERILDRITTDIKKRKKEREELEIKVNTILNTSQNIYIIQNNEERFEYFELKFKHKNGTLYSLAEESDGTVRLIELFSVLFHNDEKVFVIDEIDRSLHPLLTYNFIESFKKQRSINQLIVTTHEDYILNLNLLRRDEIWFVEKDFEGNSDMFSLEEFKERFDKDINTSYLDGRYGGIPNLSCLFSEFVEN
ncbi:AAA family ATPase [Streptococcus suis]|uniref:AAA family ATPase n=1 Tax=Streptococcus suis TaxID=1307 RepID=UPI000C18B190|nr:AAA family ATPase [Streptococcus suis]